MALLELNCSKTHNWPDGRKVLVNTRHIIAIEPYGSDDDDCRVYVAGMEQPYLVDESLQHIADRVKKAEDSKSA